MKTIFPLFLLYSAIFVSCSYSDNNSIPTQTVFESLKHEHCDWINAHTETIFVSGRQDTLSCEILNKNEGRHSMDSNVEAPDYTDYLSYDYHTNWKKESIPFLDLTVSSDDHVEFNIYFLNSQFVLTDKKRNRAVPSFIYKNKPLRDVTIAGNFHIPEVHSDSTATRIWWSKSKGIVRFETRDNKTWSKI